MASPKILVIGATGKQGGAALKHLLSSSVAPASILALTRNPESSGSKALAAKGVTLIKGDSQHPEEIFQQAGQIDRMFLLTAFTPGKDDEEAQAIPMIDASLKHGVKHMVFTSVDRGGEQRSWTNPTNIPHFEVKHRIELYLREHATGTKMSWTILRPVAFMDNLVPGFMGKTFTSMWAGVGDKPLQLIAATDIGRVGAAALLAPEKYAGKAISLAGDELNLQQAREAYQEAIGQPLPETFGFVGAGIKWMVKEMGHMFTWFKEEGYRADIPALKKEFPALMDFKTWLKEESGFKNQ